MKHKSFTPIVEDAIGGEPIIYRDNSVYFDSCCDCGLCHVVYVEIKGKEAILKLYRDDFETNKERKKEGIVIYRRKNE